MLLYKFPTPLTEAQLIARHNRFIAEVLLPDNTVSFAHCPNTGSMMGCCYPNASVMLSISDNPIRKTSYTWQLVQVNGNWVGVNTALANNLVRAALQNHLLPGLSHFDWIRQEVGVGKSRLDFLAAKDGQECFIEVKNVTLCKDGMAMFPDSPTARGQKHLDTLMEIVQKGGRGAIVFVVQRTDALAFCAASSIDPLYAQKLRSAFYYGVEIYAMQVKPTPEGIFFEKTLPVNWELLNLENPFEFKQELL